MSSGWKDPRKAAAAQRFSVARLSTRSNTLRVSKRAPNARHSTETVLASPDCSDNADGEWWLILIYVFTRTALCVILLRAWRQQAGRLRLPPAYERWCRVRLQCLSGSRLTGLRSSQAGGQPPLEQHFWSLSFSWPQLQERTPLQLNALWSIRLQVSIQHSLSSTQC